MNLPSWIWVLGTVLFALGSDITLRIASINTHFAVGTIIQAIPLFIVSTILIIWYIRRYPFTFSFQSLVSCAVYGGLEYTLGGSLYYLAIQKGGLSVASPSVQSQAIWAVIIGWLFLKERVSKMMIGGIVLFAIGIFGIFRYKSVGTKLGEGWVWAFVFGMLTGLAWTLAYAVQRVALNKGIPVPLILAIGSFTGIVTLNFFVITIFGMDVWSTVSVKSIFILLLAGCFMGSSIWCFAQAIRMVEISKVVPIVSLNIIFSTLVGVLFFKEFISVGTVISMLITLIGVFLVQELKIIQKKITLSH